MIRRIARRLVGPIIIVFLACCVKPILMDSVEVEAVQIPLQGGETSLDLDDGRFRNNGDGDVLFATGFGSIQTYTFLPVNGATAFRVGMERPDLARCLNPENIFHESDVPDITEGDYLCVKTNAGNMAVIKIEAFRFGEINSMEISYTTWFLEDE